MSISFGKKPLLTGAVFLLCNALVFAQTSSMSIRELLQLADSTSPSLATARANVASARADFTSQRAWPNPNLFLERETLDTPDGVTQSIVGVEQNISFLWTQSARTSATKYNYTAAQAEYEEIERRWAVETMELFLESEALQRRLTMLDTVVTTAEKLATTMTARRAEGDVSVYEEQRVQFELIELRSQQRQVAKEYYAVMRRLIAETGLSQEKLNSVSVALDLTAPFNSEAEALSYANEHRALLKQQDAMVSSTRQFHSAANRSTLPNLSLGAGQKTISDGGSGLVFSAGLEIPLFGQRQSERQRATANRNRAEIEQQAQRRLVEIEVRQAFEYCKQFDSLPASDEELWESGARNNMERGIQLYLEGEGSALEVIDALRTSIEAQNSALILRNSAILADLELRRVTGYKLWD